MMHIQVCTMRIYFSTGKVTPLSLNSSYPISHESVNPWVSARLEFRGWDDAMFIYTGSEARLHRLMDDSALFCLTRRPLSLTLDVPGRALVWRVLLAFSYQSAGIVPDCTLQREWHLYTPPMSASSLALIRCIMTASARLMPLKREQRVSDSNSCIYGQQ